MYKRNNMLREKRRNASFKPNRRLDAKSSRGMIYENEELRLRTININAEVERGQSEIKNLKRERELLRREIWTLRDEYDKLEKLLKIKGIDPDEFMNSNEQADDAQNQNNSEECSSCDCSSNSNEDEDNEDNVHVGTTQSANDRNLNKNGDDHRKCKERLHVNFDHLSVVSEENLTNNDSNNNAVQFESVSTPMSDLSSYLHKVDAVSPLSYLQSIVPPLAHFENINYDLIGQSFNYQTPSATSTADTLTPPFSEDGRKPKHFFSPIKKPVIASDNQPDLVINETQTPNVMAHPQSSNIIQFTVPGKISSGLPYSSDTMTTNSSFQNGGNLEELLYDIETLSKDILELSNQCQSSPATQEGPKRPYRSEISLVLSNPTSNQESTPNKIVYNQQNTSEKMHFPSPQEVDLRNQLSAKLNQSLNKELASLNNLININAFHDLKNNAEHLQQSAGNSVCLSNKSQSAPVTPSVDRKMGLKEVSKSSISDSEGKINERKIENDKKIFKRVSYSKDDDPKWVTNQLATSSKSPEDPAAGHSHKHRVHSHSHTHSKNHSRRTSEESSNNVVTNQPAKPATAQKVTPTSTTPSLKETTKSFLSRKKRSKSETAFNHENEGGTSLSERYSNSLASSRESSTSLSSKSHVRRRISITSHGGSNKIPWCGCWGNSCF